MTKKIKNIESNVKDKHLVEIRRMEIVKAAVDLFVKERLSQNHREGNRPKVWMGIKEKLHIGKIYRNTEKQNFIKDIDQS